MFVHSILSAVTSPVSAVCVSSVSVCLTDLMKTVPGVNTDLVRTSSLTGTEDVHEAMICIEARSEQVLRLKLGRNSGGLCCTH